MAHVLTLLFLYITFYIIAMITSRSIIFFSRLQFETFVEIKGEAEFKYQLFIPIISQTVFPIVNNQKFRGHWNSNTHVIRTIGHPHNPMKSKNVRHASMIIFFTLIKHQRPQRNNPEDIVHLFLQATYSGHDLV